MPKKIIIMLFVTIMFQVLIGQTIMEIQQTSDPGENGTFPSSYQGQEVTISPVVIGAKGFNGSENNLFALDLNPGLWNGIYINNANNSASEKALVSLTGTVNENNGMTELTNTTLTILNPGPMDVSVNSINLSDIIEPSEAEKYESSLVKINNLQYTGESFDSHWIATDGQGNEIKIGTGFYSYNPETGDEFGSITGFIFMNGSELVLHPRDNNDFVPSTPATLAVHSDIETVGDKLYAHISSSNIKDYWGINGFEFTFSYSDEYLEYQNFEIDLPGLTDTNDQVTEIVDDGVYTLKYSLNQAFTSLDTPQLITLIFDIVDYGVASVSFSEFVFHDEDYSSWVISDLSALNISYNNVYDTKKAYLSIRNDNNDKNIFSPYMNERLTIKYGFKPGYSTKTIVRIYDLKGRLVYTPVNKVHSGLGEYRWDGRDKNRELVDIGTYICQVEVVVRDSGDKYITDQPIVVAGQLK